MLRSPQSPEIAIGRHFASVGGHFASVAPIANKLRSAETYASVTPVAKMDCRARRENSSVVSQPCCGHLSRKKTSVGGHLYFARPSPKKLR